MSIISRQAALYAAYNHAEANYNSNPNSRAYQAAYQIAGARLRRLLSTASVSTRILNTRSH